METYSQIKDEIAELFKSELAALDKNNKTDTPNIPKPGEKPLSKKQRRQVNKRDRQRERENMRKLKADDDKPSGHNEQSKSPIKNDDMEQAMSM